MSEWGDFYLTVGAAAAALMGLMFIAVTFGARLVTGETVGIARSILSPIFYHFAQTFVISCAALMPGVGQNALGITAVGTALLRLGMIPNLIKQMKLAQSTKGEIERSDWILSVLLPAILYVPMFVAGLFVFSGSTSALITIGIVTVALLVLGSFTAWDMLIWMASKVSGEA